MVMVQRVSANAIDFLSNGFKLRQVQKQEQCSGTYVYMAFAEHHLSMQMLDRSLINIRKELGEQ